MISSLLFSILISLIECGLYSESIDVIRNGNINLRNGHGGEYAQFMPNYRGGGSYELSGVGKGIDYLQGQSYSTPNSYASCVRCHPSDSSYLDYPNPYSSPSSRPIALVINNYPPKREEEVKPIIHIDSHYSRPIKYRPPPNKIAHSENWYGTLMVKPYPTTLPPPVVIPPSSYVPPPYQPDMSKYIWTANLASKSYAREGSASYYASPPNSYSTGYVSP